MVISVYLELLINGDLQIHPDYSSVLIHINSGVADLKYEKRNLSG
jgi:hypothetical protein